MQVKIVKFFTDWYHAYKEKHISKMKEQGKCPVCRGHGFSTITSPYTGNTIDCHLCDGTGLYAEWEKNK
jgi:excinuclease UvrABC ATPase subunit